MIYSVTKLDNRHSWHIDFKYMIEFKKSSPGWAIGTKTSSGVLNFDRARRWFNTTFGWSQDVETRQSIVTLGTKKQAQVDQDYNLKWAYSIKYDDYRIYVDDESTLNWFVLSHPHDK